MNAPIGPVETAAFEAANSRAYLKAVFQAWAEGKCVMAQGTAARGKTVPGISIGSRESFEPDPGWFEADMPLRPAGDRALIAFSSGTTGQPKAILLSHGALQDVVSRINGAMGVTSEIREYLGVPVTYSFGFGRARAVASAGGRAFLPEHGFDPSEIARMLAADDINAVSAVPTLWRVLLANKGTISQESAQKLRWIEIGSQWMTAAEKLELRQLFPNARIVQHYGLTEASRTTFLDISAAPEDRLDSVGRAVGDVEIAIDDEGRIRTRGPHIATGLIQEAGIKSVTDAEGWLTTSDRGRIDDGWLYYEGRVDELINSGGLKIDPTAFEAAINTALGVPGAVAAGRLSDPLRGEKVLLVLKQGAGLDRDAVTEAAISEASRIGLTGNGAFELRDVAEIPVTETGKIQRAKLADLPDLTKTADPAASPNAADDPRTAELQQLWGELLKLDSVPIDKGFYDLGGDSLSALTAIMKMESLGIEADVARGIFDGKTIAELARFDSGAPETPKAPVLSLAKAAQVVHAARGVLVLWVVLIHWLPSFLQRLGDNTMWIYEALAPAWRFGTPGFAMVFGMGVGALGLHHYQSNPERFQKNAWFNARLIIAGICLMAIIKLLIIIAEGNFGERIPMSGLFYSAITYYALAMLTLPWLVWLVLRGENRMLTIFTIGAGAWIIHSVLREYVAPLQPPAFFEFLKITFTAKYGFFRMTGFVMVGMAIGYLFRRHHDSPGLLRDLLLAGFVLIGFGGVGVHQSNTGPSDFTNVYLWHLTLYAGVAVLVLSFFVALNRGGGPKVWLINRLNVFAIATGIMALPIFVGHEVIGFLKQFFDVMGVPDMFSLVGLLAIFCAALTVAYVKLMRFLR
ncbi:MAG: AMP-binding protein [Pseudomonadota bacterium]